MLLACQHSPCDQPLIKCSIPSVCCQAQSMFAGMPSSVSKLCRWQSLHVWRFMKDFGNKCFNNFGHYRQSWHGTIVTGCSRATGFIHGANSSHFHSLPMERQPLMSWVTDGLSSSAQPWSTIAGILPDPVALLQSWQERAVWTSAIETWGNFTRSWVYVWNTARVWVLGLISEPELPWYLGNMSFFLHVTWHGLSQLAVAELMQYFLLHTRSGGQENQCTELLGECAHLHAVKWGAAPASRQYQTWYVP